jgi:excisionase family DNA binding protein
VVTQSGSLTKKPGTPRLPVGDSRNRSNRSLRHHSSDIGRQTASQAIPEAAPPSGAAGGSATTNVARQSQILAGTPQRSAFQKERSITVKEAAFRAGKSEATIHDWLRGGRLRGWQPGGRRCFVLVEEASLEEALGFLPSPRRTTHRVAGASRKRKNPAGAKGSRR